MRTRTRRLDSVLLSAAPNVHYNAVRYNCDGSLGWTGSGVDGRNEPVYLSYKDEYMVDQLVHGSQVGYVKHVRSSLERANPGTNLKYATPLNEGRGYYDVSFADGGDSIITQAIAPEWTPPQWTTQEPYLPACSYAPPLTNDGAVVSRLYNGLLSNTADHLLNLLEAEDIPRVVRTFADSYGYLKQLWGSNRYRSLINQAKKMSKHAANLWLAKQFGIDPLISDIKATKKAIDNWDKITKQYSSGKRVRRSQVLFGSVNYVPSTISSTSIRALTGSTIETTRYFSNPKVTYTASALPNIPRYFNEGFTQLDLLFRRFTDSGPFTELYQLIPFSFVVDWFVDLSTCLSFLDGLVRTDLIKDEMFSKSTKGEGTITINIEVRTSCESNPALIHVYPSAIGRYSYYERVGLYKDIGLFLANRFHLTQAADSAALLRQVIMT